MFSALSMQSFYYETSKKTSSQEHGVVQIFSLNKDDFQIIHQLLAIALRCLGLAPQNLVVSVPSTLGERDETHFYQPYQIWTFMNEEDDDLFCR